MIRCDLKMGAKRCHSKNSIATERLSLPSKCAFALCIHKPKFLCVPFPFLPVSLPTSASLFCSQCVCVCVSMFMFMCMCACVRVRVVQCAGREQLEHLQSSLLTAAQHMAGPCEGWVLSPGKVLTHRQEH